MRVLTTNDGAIGVEVDPACDIIWCHTRAEALEIIWGEVKNRNQFTKSEVQAELTYALDHMAQQQHNIAEFGVLGSFLYSSKEKDNEF